MKNILRKIFYGILSVIGKITGTRFYKHLPAGVDVYYDLKHYFPHFEALTVFDVGANNGQTAIEYVEHFPKANIYSFEPTQKAYTILTQTVGHLPKVKCLKLALSSAPGIARMSSSEGTTEQNKITSQQQEGLNYEEVELITLDTFCQKNDIKHIHLLKIDTEGHDFEVLKGAENLINNMQIDLIQVEAGINPQNTLHVPFVKFKEYLESKGYLLFKIYDQVYEWPTGASTMRYCNPIFASTKLLNANIREYAKL